MKSTIKKNDNIIVIAGDEKGKKGRVLSVIPENNRLVVVGVNMVKKHMKPNKQFQQGGIIDKEAPLSRSNVMLVCGKCNKPSRIAKKTLENNKKVRVCKQCGEVVD